MVRALLLGLSLLLVAEGASASTREPVPDWAYVRQKLVKAKFSKAYIAELKKIYDYDHFIKVLELNILAYLRTTDYHGPQVNRDAVKEVRDFVDKNRSTFKTIEKRYGVPPETISSLLYIETRHGANKGSFHVASVFLHILQADRPPVERYLKARLPHYTTKYDKKTQAEIARRTKRKAKWALEELAALKVLFERDEKMLRGLKGSFSGAFGMAQFIPTSYKKLARPFKKGKTPDLGKPDDAITSVAHYLHSHGWKKTKKRSHKRALMHYNNSEDYAEAILGLAKRARDATVKQQLTNRPKPLNKRSPAAAGR